MIGDSLFRRRAFTIVATLVAATFCGAAWADGEPLEPADALAAFRLDAGLQIELVACEPQVIDPIALRFDEDGRLWVVEMRDYPHGPPEGQPPLSKIRLLADADGDGRYERSTEFADDLLFPTGLQPWQGGLIVTLAGEVAYLKDTDGDGRADLRETWFRGFATENPQLRANHPRFGLDNRVTVANGLRGGTIENLRQNGSEPLSISGRDFRFEPRSGACEAISGNGQFGLTADEFGNRFVCSNRQPLDHVVLENRYLARNPFLAVPAVTATVAAAGEQSRVFPLTRAWTTSNLHAGQFTAACGVTIYRGDALGAAYRGNAFICEPTGSLVHRETVEPRGATFVSRPGGVEAEFLASTDSWFRPVNLEIGPDGALYVVDMYRAVIEHPQFMPSELQARPDLRLGDDRGRIYRIVPAGGASKTAPPRLSAASSQTLVEALAKANGWWRETAGRLLYERQDASAVEQLERLAAEAKRPEARVAALWALQGLDTLSSERLRATLENRDARVREQGVALAESLLDDDAPLRRQVIALAADDDPRVRFRVALALGGINSSKVIAPLAAIAERGADDVWTRRAVATARAEHTGPVLLAILKSETQTKEPGAATADLRPLVGELATIVGARRDEADVRALLEIVCSETPSGTAAGEAALLGLGRGMAGRGGLVTFVSGLADADSLASRLNATFDRAADAALDDSLSPTVRASKLALLEHARGQRATDACLQLVETCSEQNLRIAAAEALATKSGERIAKPLLAGYAVQSPAVRRAIVEALCVDPAAAMALLEAIRTGRVARAELDAARENRLRQHRDAAVAKLAKDVLVVAVPAQREAVLAEYRPALELEPDPAAGKELFRQHCAACHHIGDMGVDVAPDISDSRVKTPAQLLTDILNPNQAIDNNYLSYTIATRNGNVYTGIISAETAGSITLRQQENKTVALLRADVEAIRTSGVSLMPEGFEKHLSRQQLADLIGFIKNWRYLDGQIPARIAPE